MFFFFPLVYAFGIPVLRMRVNIPRPGGGFQPDGREIQLPSGVAMRIAEDHSFYFAGECGAWEGRFPRDGNDSLEFIGGFSLGRIPPY